MAGIAQALRRALAEAAERGARAGRGGEMDMGMALGSIPGMLAGGAIGGGLAAAEGGDASDGSMVGIVPGAIAGMAAGAGAGGLVKLARMAGGAGRGGFDGLRRALAELGEYRRPRLTEREMREAFTARPFARLSDEALDEAGYQPYTMGGWQLDEFGRPNATNAMRDHSAHQRKLAELQRERRFAQSQEELDDIDTQISWIMRDLGA